MTPDYTYLDIASRSIRGLGSSSPVSAMNAAETKYRQASLALIKANNENPSNPRMEMPK